MELLYVPDPTVIIRWAVRPAGDKEQDRSLDLLHLWLEGGCEFLLPNLWLHEVGAALARLHPERAADLLELLIEYRLPEARMTADICRSALGLMKSHETGYFEAIYHAVALQNGGIFVTSDSSYHRKAKGAGGVMLLKDFTPR